MSLKYHKIFTHDHLNAREVSEVYMSDSSDHGRIFIILELPKHKIDQQPYVDELINQAATYFDTSGQEDPETLLEEILQEINQLLPEMAGSIKIRNWINTLDLAIGIMSGDNIYISSIGSINGLLMHNNQITTIVSKNTDINPAKAFSDIISGQLDEGDSLIISTNSLFDYISKEKIKQIIGKYSPSAAAIKINELLESVPEFVTFNSILIKKPGLGDMDINPEQARQASHIQQELDIKISDTIEKTPQDTIGKPKTKLVVDVKGFKNIGIFQKIGNLFSLAGTFFQMVASIFVYIFQKIKASILFLTSKKYRKAKEEKTIDSIKNVTDKKYYWFKNLSIKKKIAVVTLFVILLIFLQSLIFLTQEKADEEKNQYYDNTLISIQNKYDEADAKLIYNDEEASENILLEIKDLIDSLKASSPEQQENIDQLNETLFHKLNKVRHIHVVDMPMELFDMGSLVSVPQSIVQKNGIFYILGDNKLYEIKDNTLNTLYDFTENQTVQSMTNWPDTEKIVIYTQDSESQGSYKVFDISQKKIVGELKKSADNQAVGDLAIYGNNLYVLDQSSNQIFKYPESGSSFAGGIKWLQEEADLSQTSSLTIDGGIYIIDNSGKIQNFLKGQEEDFNYHEPRPTIGQSAKIKTFRDSAYLYIIDPQNMRIVILDKDGNIKDQYTSQKFDNLLDLAVDPDEKAIYLLNANHLYLLAINE
ncbi:hypothetical protein KKH39_03095 [Patescibacteria group bacterium]|nr:hypothetical protein [Patescibacteria group bacterium]